MIADLKEFFRLLFRFDQKALFVTPTQNGFVQFFRFVFVGGIATVVDVFTVTVAYEWCGLQKANLLWFGFDGGLLIAGVIGFVLGLSVNYLLSIIWIFRYQNINRLKEFLSFALIGIVGLVVKLTVTALLERFVLNMEANVLGVIPMVTVVAAIGTIVAFVWNFAARKYLLYNRKNVERLKK